MKHLLAFLLGAGAGVIGTYLYFNNKIENIIDEKVNKEMEFFYEHQTQTLSEDDVEEVKEEEIKEKESDKPETQEKTSIQKMESVIRTNYREPDKDTDHGNDGIELELDTLLQLLVRVETFLSVTLQSSVHGQMAQVR
jgi:phage terminase small subunit